ncbi:hypothetical protein CDAR_247231 [Caerostris darwini]|uniref:Uncharacterized protein n=1 Tax=Caerostris darwini TaxID=1538125 RepID=A0AAV4X1Q1_9ARAC|nr:hypothetical protein CDAR_247231 [Caerostris darwini]
MAAACKQLVFTTPKEKDFEAVIDFLGLISIEPSSKQRSWLGRQVNISSDFLLMYSMQCLFHFTSLVSNYSATEKSSAFFDKKK